MVLFVNLSTTIVCHCCLSHGVMDHDLCPSAFDVLSRELSEFLSFSQRVSSPLDPMHQQLLFSFSLCVLFVAGNATYKSLCLSVGRSVGRSVGWSRFYFLCANGLYCPSPTHYCPCSTHFCLCPTHYCPCPTHYCPCPTARDKGCRVYRLV